MRNDGLTNEGSTTIGLHVGGDCTLAKDRGEIVIGDVVNLLNTRSAEVGAVERVGLAGGNRGNDVDEFAESQGTDGGLNAGKGLGNAKLVAIRGTASPVEYSTVYHAMKTYSARQMAFLTVG